MLNYFDVMGANREVMQKLYADDERVCSRSIKLTNLSRIFVALLVVQCVVILTTGSSIFDNWAKIFTLPVVLTTIATLIVACHFFETGKEFMGRVTLIATVSTSCIMSVVFCGGFFQSPATPMLIFPMVLAFCTMSAKIAKWVFLATIAVPLTIDVIVRYVAIELPNFTAQTNETFINFNILSTLFLAIYFCLFHLKNTRHESSAHSSK